MPLSTNKDMTQNCSNSPNTSVKQDTSQNIKDQEEHPSAKTNKYNKVACSECNSLITEINIKWHMLNVHNIDTTVYGICVDQYESIFMVPHNTRGKVNPVHCQKKIQGQNTNVMCEVTDCINAIQVATHMQ